MFMSEVVCVCMREGPCVYVRTVSVCLQMRVCVQLF